MVTIIKMNEQQATDSGDEKMKRPVTLHRDLRHQQLAVVTAGVSATVLLIIALLNRISLAGPCTINGFHRSAVCTQLVVLPGHIPHNTQVLHCDNHDEPEHSAGLRTLDRFNFSTLRQLRELVLMRCGIQQLSTDVFSFIPQLRRLDLRYNQIRHIAGNQFRGIVELEYLLLSSNPLTELGDDAFHGVTVGRLEFADNPSLRYISDTALTSSRISTLVLCGCDLKHVSRQAMRHVASNLRELVISNNQQPLHLDVHLFQDFHLRRLVLTNNQLNSCEFLVHGDHDEIVLDHNDQLWMKLPGSSRAARKRTRRLSLRNTSLSSLSSVADLSFFSDVEELNLSNNQLDVLRASHLESFERLRLLDLSQNLIQQLTGNFTSVLQRLDLLNLTNNRLETLDEATWRPLVERLKSAIILTGNPLHYNCELRWLVEQDKLMLADNGSSSLQCTSPVITNTSVLLEDDQLYIVCEARGDPAPRVTWSTDNDRLISRVEPSTTRRRDVFVTRNRFSVSRLTNYTCTASNVLAAVTVTLDLSSDLPHAWTAAVSRRNVKLDVINTPLGFLVTLASTVLLAYLLKHR